MSVLVPPDQQTSYNAEHEWRQHQQIYGLLTGQSEWGAPVDLISYDSDSRYAVVIKNLGTGGALSVLGSDGVNRLSVGDAGAVISALNVAGNLTVNGTLQAGASTLASLAVTAGATIGTTLSTGGLATLQSLSVAANATVNGTLGAGATTVTDLTSTGTSILGNANTDTHTQVGLTTFRNAAASSTQMYVDSSNHRVLVGTGTALTGTVSSMLEVTGISYFTPSVAGEVALNIWRSPSAAAGWGVGVTATDQLKFTDNGGQGILTIGDTSSTYKLEVTGAGHIIGDFDVSGDVTAERAAIGTTTFSGTEELRVVGQSRFEGAIDVTTGSITLSGGGISTSASSSITGGLTVISGGVAVTGNSTVTGNFTATGTINKEVSGSTYWRVGADGIPDWLSATLYGTGSGGAAATLGNVSSSSSTGPTTAARGYWLKVKIGGGQVWIPAWG